MEGNRGVGVLVRQTPAPTEVHSCRVQRCAIVGNAEDEGRGQVDGRVIGYDDAQHFVEQAKYRSRFIPTAGAIAIPETKPVQGEWLFV